ncbi:MAG TPA: hypothetical protein VFG83_07575, partial [Kofleriaceae bacterium]|nr:hypothetical protein [Kofleriaceae bacterium]
MNDRERRRRQDARSGSAAGTAIAPGRVTAVSRRRRSRRSRGDDDLNGGRNPRDGGREGDDRDDDQHENDQRRVNDAARAPAEPVDGAATGNEG